MPDTVIRLGTDLPYAHTRIGPKAANLNHLTLAGFPVPPGICIPVEVFQTALAPFARQIDALCAAADLRDPHVAHSTAQTIARLLDELDLPLDLRAELARAVPTLGSDVLVVRSSATLEDLAGTSFAGQYETILGVKGAAALIQAILTCWRSFFAANALAARAAYAAQHLSAGDDRVPGMAVLIQPLLPADCAGVCFSVDPVQRRADRLLVTASWGLGSGVVDGSVPVDNASVRRQDFAIAEALIADKHTCIRYAPDEANPNLVVQPVAVAADQRRVACLPENWLKRVAQFALAAEQHFGSPQDVEWAIVGEQFWLLQSRPITTLPKEVLQATRFPITWASEEERKRSWWLNHFNDRPAAVLLPAEIEFIQAGSTGGGAAAVVQAGGAKTRWRTAVNGRIYMAVADSSVSPGDQRIRQAALRDLFTRLEEQNITLWEHWGPEIIRATERLDAFDPQGAEGNALADHLEDTLAAAQRHCMIHTMTPRDNGSERLLATYRQMTRKSQAAAAADLPFLVQGTETVQTRLIELLYDLAALALTQPVVVAALQQPTPEGYARLRDLPTAAPFVQQFEQLLSLYGGRPGLFTRGQDGTHPVPLSLPWRTAPEHVLEMVSHYLPLARENGMDKGANPPRAAREQARQVQQAKVDALCAAADPALATQFRHCLEYARRSLSFLDDHNHYIDQLSEGQYAQALLYAGRWLTARGDLPQPYEVFWLHPPEILAALRAATQVDHRQAIAERKAQFAHWSSLQTPAYIGLPDPQLPAAAPRATQAAEPAGAVQPMPANTLIGQAVSAGKGRGRARVIHEAVTLPAVAPGDVLVAAQVTPLWTTLFPTLAGIVLDGGWLGDHSAITAREFGVPAVFGTVNATDQIPQGAWVMVDCATGRVTWE